jgi:hypothetical protein
LIADYFFEREREDERLEKKKERAKVLIGFFFKSHFEKEGHLIPITLYDDSKN